MCDQVPGVNTVTMSSGADPGPDIGDSCAGPDIAPFDDGEQFEDSEFRPATEVFTGGDLDFLQQHGTQSSSVSHLAR